MLAHMLEPRHRLPARPDRARLVPETFRRAGAVPEDALVTVRQGVQVWKSEWDELYAEGRIRTRAHAVFARARGDRAVASHATAAALHRLPLYRVRDDRIEVTCPGSTTRHNAGDVVRHQASLANDEIEVIDGIPVTSLARTVYDVIRSVSLEAAVGVFDAALRSVAWNDRTRTLDAESDAAFRSRIDTMIRGHAGARGIRQARFVAEVADGRAQLPGESIARLGMLLLGAPTPDLQYRVEDGSGRLALLDFAFPSLGRWLEFDGSIKYDDPYLLGDQTAEEVLDAQAERESWVRRVTGWRVDRFGFDEARDLSDLAKFLRGIGLIY